MIKKLGFILFKTIKVIALICLSSYLGLICFLLYKENNMLYWGQGGKALMNHYIPDGFKEGFIETKNANLQYYKKEGDINLPVVVYFGGNGEHANLSLDWLKKEFSDNEIYSINYPNYGKSTGSVGQKSIEEALLEAVTKLVGDRKVVLVGRSLGSGFATFVGSNLPNLQKLVLITPYSKITEVACNRFLYVPSFVCSSFMDNQMDNVSNMSKITVPILILYVDKDSTIENQNTEELIKVIPNSKVVKIKDTNHNSVMNHEVTLKVVKEFTDE